MRQFVISGLFAMFVITSPAMAQKSKKSKVKPKTKAASVTHQSSVKAPWRLAYHDSRVSVMIDTSKSRKLPDDTYSTRLQWKYAKDQATEGHKYRTMTETRLLDCTKMQSKSLSAVATSTTGKTVSSFTTPDDEVQYLMWSKRKEGSSNAKALSKTCTMLKASKL